MCGNRKLWESNSHATPHSPVDHTNDAKLHRYYSSHKYIHGICASIHEIQLCDHSKGTPPYQSGRKTVIYIKLVMYLLFKPRKYLPKVKTKQKGKGKKGGKGAKLPIKQGHAEGKIII